MTGIAPGVALILWALALPKIGLASIPDSGLVARLPLEFFAALACLCLSFGVLTVRNPRHAWPWLWHLVPLVAVLHGTLAVLYTVPRFGWTYKHFGVVEYIRLHGGVNPLVDAYHSWPGFFAAAAMLLELTGASAADLMALARWAQPAFNLVFIGPLVLMLSSLTRDRRALWLAAWLFSLTNWISQDYFAPQAFGFLLYLCAVGAVLRWFGATPNLGGWLGDSVALDASPPAATGRFRVALAAVLALLFVVVAASHQLSPLMLAAALAALTLAGRVSSPLLLAGLLAATLLWDATMASAYFAGQSSWRDSFGQLLGNLRSLPDTLEQSDGRAFVGRVMRGFVLAIWGLAAIGFLRRWREGRLPWRVALLAVAPFPMVAFGSYGGEIVLRIYLFSLPAVSLLAAWALVPAGWRGHGLASKALAAGLIAAVSAALAAGFLFSYLGKEQQNRIRPANVAVLEALYRQAKPGSLIIAISDSCCMAFKLTGTYDAFEHLSLVDDRTDRERRFSKDDLDALAERLRRERRPAAYFVFARTFEEYFAENNILARGEYARLERLVRAAGWRRTLENGDASVFELVNPAVGP